MNYELAKKLKDAGFLQPNVDESDEDNFLFNDGYAHSHYELQIGKNNPCYQPTLSELIEACGDRFLSLRKNVFNNTWFATAIPLSIFSRSYQAKNCSTPEEAVANLWLELNEKLR